MGGVPATRVRGHRRHQHRRREQVRCRQGVCQQRDDAFYAALEKVTEKKIDRGQSGLKGWTLVDGPVDWSAEAPASEAPAEGPVKRAAPGQSTNFERITRQRKNGKSKAAAAIDDLLYSWQVLAWTHSVSKTVTAWCSM